jgi:hypothetical protein
MNIKKAITRWEEAVWWIEDGWDCSDEYTNDVNARHSVFKLLEASDQELPTALKKQLDAADARYRAATVDDWPFAVFENVGGLDRERHWYLFRRPEAASLRAAWETSPEFRALVMASNPELFTDDSNR